MASKDIKVDLNVGGAVDATGSVSTDGTLISNYSAGDEGGEIKLAIPQTNSTISDGVTIDIYQNKLRIFESGGDNQGAYIDLSAASAGVGSDLLAGGGGGISNVVEDTTPQLGGDLDAQGYNITNVEYISLDTTPASVPSTTGSIYWDVDMETANLQLPGATLQIGQEHIIRVKNSSGSVSIPDRTPVMFAGATGDTVTVTPAISSNISTYPSDYFVGITTEEIPADGFGFVTQFGFVNNVNTNSWTVGTLLYVDPSTAGGLTATRPSAPAWQTPIGAVTRQNSNSGRILVRAIPGISLNHVEGVEITSPTDNELLAYNSADGTWINQTYNEAGLNKVYYQASAPSSSAVGDVWIDSNDDIIATSIDKNDVEIMIIMGGY